MKARLTLTVLAGLVAAPVIAAAPATAASSDTATVSVVHGVPGLTVDIYANGKELLSNVTPGTVSDELSVPAGSYDLAVFKDGEGPSGTPAISANDVEVPAGANATVAAYLTDAGTPTLGTFVNDTSAVAGDKARVTVRHAAAAPAVDVRAGETVLFDNLTHGKEASGEVEAGTVSADVVLAGTETVAIGPADLDLAAGSNTVVYAWGSQDAGYKIATQSLSSGKTPSGVHAGESGAASQGLPAGLIALSSLAALGALAAAGLLVRARRTDG